MAHTEPPHSVRVSSERNLDFYIDAEYFFQKSKLIYGVIQVHFPHFDLNKAYTVKHLQTKNVNHFMKCLAIYKHKNIFYINI